MTDAAGNATAFERDGNGNLTKLTDAKQHDTAFTYDSMDRVASRKDPLLETETFEHDKNGNLTKHTDRKGQVTTLSYDELDRLTFTGYGTTGTPENLSYQSTIEYSFDDGDRLTQAVDSAYGTISRVYDELDRLTSETSEEGSVSYAYDAAGRRQAMTVGGQPQVAYGYDNADQLTGLTRGSVSVALAYDDLSRLQTLTLPNGIVQSYTYDDASNLTGINYQRAGQTIGDLVYGNDPNGLRSGIGGSYARTGLPAAVASASYDAGDRLTSWAGQSLGYDDNGSMTGDGSKSFSWNARGELTSLSGGGTSASFAYDAFGRRARMTIDGAVTRYLYDDANIAQELSDTLTPQTNLLSGLELDSLFALLDGAGTRSVLTDALGSTIALADTTGALAIEYTYEPFGRSIELGSGGSNYQYTGRENDGTGLQFSRARYYNPTLGRFISEDPLGLVGGDINLYAYVANSVPNAADPTGTDAAAIGAGAVTKTGSGALQIGAAGVVGLKAGSAARKYAHAANPTGESSDADGDGSHLPLGDPLGVPPLCPPEDVACELGITNTKLRNIINNLYKHYGGSGTRGDGTTMADPSRHVEKLRNEHRGLENLIKSGRLNAHDRAVAARLKQAIVDSLRSIGLTP